MQQEQNYKAVKASERLPEREDIQFRMIADKKVIDVYSYWSDTHLELNDADALGQPVGTLVPKTDVEWLEPIPIPDAEVLREALERAIGVIEMETDDDGLVRELREALSAGDGWVRVEEKKFIPNTMYILWGDDWQQPVEGSYWAFEEDEGWHTPYGDKLFLVTHHHPLPSPPKK